MLPWRRLSSCYAVCPVIPEDCRGTEEVQHVKSAWRKEPWNLETINCFKCVCYNVQFVICQHFTRYFSLAYTTRSPFYLHICLLIKDVKDDKISKLFLSCNMQSIVKCFKQVNIYVTIIKKARKRCS